MAHFVHSVAPLAAAHLYVRALRMSEPSNSSLQATEAVAPRKALVQCVLHGSLPPQVLAVLGRSLRNTQRLSRAARPCGRSASQERFSNVECKMRVEVGAFRRKGRGSRNSFKLSVASKHTERPMNNRKSLSSLARTSILRALRPRSALTLQSSGHPTAGHAVTLRQVR